MGMSFSSRKPSVVEGEKPVSKTLSRELMSANEAVTSLDVDEDVELDPMLDVPAGAGAVALLAAIGNTTPSSESHGGVAGPLKY
jgi:hypothetical protein